MTPAQKSDADELAPHPARDANGRATDDPVRGAVEQLAIEIRRFLDHEIRTAERFARYGECFDVFDARPLEELRHSTTRSGLSPEAIEGVDRMFSPEGIGSFADLIEVLGTVERDLDRMGP